MAYRQMPPGMMWYQGSIGNMYDPMIEEEDEQDLAMLYPGLYHRVMPLVMYYGDQMEMRYGAMYSPTGDEVGKITDNIYDRLKMDINIDEYDEQDENEEDSRQRPRGRRAIRDLIRILFLRDLHRRRRRRRRRRRPNQGGY
ncbi:hypothetical protein JK636_22675 [Clostridium sp. YIM B02515]|uniref:Uncharacterized protein n=1 Tax=Clostridium rhizosphaerae TaxID=2803861 RepID=A0ABS1TKL4_9CLOT|nr:hypothetical protein [Clostridium rhizosphaerae]MBL4938513.1 hypothetical protein [Clostridium rhizosphaerae]